MTVEKAVNSICARQRVNKGWGIMAVIALLFLIMVTIVPHHASARDLPESFAPLVDKAMPAVVNISTTSVIKTKAGDKKYDIPEFPPGSPFNEFKEFFERMDPEYGGGDEEQKSSSLGSGFIIDPAGYIVTNNHVIADADEIVVNYGDDKTAEAKVVGRDTKTDLALLKIEVAKPLPYVSFGDSDKARVGDWVLAIGNPFGLGGTVTSGIVSARARDINAGPFDDFLQTDAAINRGNSGGPLFNIDGEVIGINTAIYTPSGGSVGVGFAVPAAMAEPIINQLKKNGKVIRAWLGVKIQTVTPEIAETIGLAKSEGAMVVEVIKDSPAEKAHMKVGDVILRFDGKKIAAMRKLPRIVAETDIGKKAAVEIWRDQKKLDLAVILGKLDEAEEQKILKPKDVSEGEEIDDAVNILEMKLVTLTDKIKEKYSLGDLDSGVLVVSRDRKSVAASRGIRAGDVIRSVNQQSVKDVHEFEKLVEQSRKEKRKSILLLVLRDNVSVFFALPLDEKSAQ